MTPVTLPPKVVRKLPKHVHYCAIYEGSDLIYWVGDKRHAHVVRGLVALSQACPGQAIRVHMDTDAMVAKSIGSRTAVAACGRRGHDTWSATRKVERWLAWDWQGMNPGRMG